MYTFDLLIRANWNRFFRNQLQGNSTDALNRSNVFRGVAPRLLGGLMLIRYLDVPLEVGINGS